MTLKFYFSVDTEADKNDIKLDLLTAERPPPALVVQRNDDQDNDETYDYPSPDDKDSEFRRRCKDRSKYILSFC